jgi:ABC-type proline/glycine betaine transport system substrate-binding protein
MNKRSLYALALTGALAPMAAQADCGKVSVGEMNWTSGGIIASITEFILTQGYGCEVTVVPSATTTAITSLAENNEPDIVPEFWPNGAPAYYDLAEQGKVVKASDAFSEGGTEHWLVPADLVEKHPELATIEGVLANPDLVGGRPLTLRPTAWMSSTTARARRSNRPWSRRWKTTSRTSAITGGPPHRLASTIWSVSIWDRSMSRFTNATLTRNAMRSV